MTTPHGDHPSAEPGSVADSESLPEFPQANAVAVKAISEVLAGSLGPTSRDKLIVQNIAAREEPARGDVAIDDFVATSDGATILEKLPLEHPIAPVVKRMVGPERAGETDVVGEEISDGVTTSVVLAAALLDEASELLEKGVHPQDIIRGYHQAGHLAESELASHARSLDAFDDSRTSSEAVARTAMTGNDVGGYADKWARIAVDAVNQIGFPTEKTLAVRQIRDGSIGDSRLVRGAVLDRNSRVTDAMPQQVEDASILVLGGHNRGGLRTPETPEDLTATVESPDEIESYDDVFDNWRQDVFQRILDTDVDVVVTELGIDDRFLELLASHDIVGIRSVNWLELTQVALATGATVVSDPTDVSSEFLGYAGTVEEQIIEPREGGRKRRRMTVFDDCREPESVCVLLRGVNDYIEAQATTMIRKAASSVAATRGEYDRQPGIVPGGGAVDAYLASVVRDASAAEGSRASLALEAYADALEQVPFTLAKNAGADPIDVLAELRAANSEAPEVGFLLPAGELGDPIAAGVLDSVALRADSLWTATSVTNLLLRVDDAIDAEFTEEQSDPGEAIYDDDAKRYTE